MVAVVEVSRAGQKYVQGDRSGSDAKQKMLASRDNLYVILLTRSNWRVTQAFGAVGITNTVGAPVGIVHAKIVKGGPPANQEGPEPSVIQPPPISKQLKDEIHKAEKMHDFISGTVPDKFVGDTDQKILVAAIYSLTSATPCRNSLPAQSRSL